MITIWIKSQLNQLVSYLVACSKPTYKPSQISTAIISGSVLEMVVVPVLLISIGKQLDYIFTLGVLFPNHRVVAPSALAFCLGLVWLFWSIFTQYVQGKGTPLPLVPTKTLLVCGPYKYTRNPMAFGAVFWLLGWAFLANSPAALWAVVVFMIIIAGYIKLVEEKELEQRFGQEYISYRQQTPFIIPHLFGRR